MGKLEIDWKKFIIEVLKAILYLLTGGAAATWLG